MIFEKSPQNDIPDWHNRVRQFLTQSALAAASDDFVPLTGDASNRRYVRVFPKAINSFVLAVSEQRFEYEKLPFVIVSKLLNQLSVPVPEILEHVEALGILALEDLGDVTLQAHVGTGPATDHEALYAEAIDHIVTLQQHRPSKKTSTLLPFTMTFDAKKFLWELNYFLKYFVGAYRGIQLPPSHHEMVNLEFIKLSEELGEEPRLLCHRDFHSRNLMLHQNQLYVIDFQDARMGPATYDLSSLLRDSYVDISEDTVNKLIGRYIEKMQIKEGLSEFRCKFDTMALQRNLKALGTFGYQTTARRNPVYIQYIPRTIRYIRDTLLHYPKFSRLHDLLSTYISDLK
jgi:hypothetical protein